MTQVLHCLNSSSANRLSMINDEIESMEKEAAAGFVPDSDDEDQEGISAQSIDRVCRITHKTANSEQESPFNNCDASNNQERDSESKVAMRCSQNSYSDKCLSRVNGSRIRKLYNEEPLSKIENFIASQEPSKLTQDIAMNVVDKLLCDSEVGSCQDIGPVKTMDSNSLPILSAEGAQCLAKWANRRNSVRELTTFDWHENERTEFTNESRRVTKKLHSQMLKPLNADTSTRKISKYASHPNIRDSSSTEKLHTSKTERNQLLEDGGAQLNTKDDVEVEEMYDIGPNTQMAAEAMGGLRHGSPLNHGLSESTHPETVNLNEDMNMCVPLDRTPTDHASHSKRDFLTCDLKGNLICYKRRKLQSTKLIEDHTCSSRKYSKSTKKKMGTWDEGICLNISDATNANKLTRSPGQNNKRSSEDSSIREVEMSGISRTSNIQFPAIKRHMRGDLAFNAIPVAPRTRRSKPTKISNWSKKFSDQGNALFVAMMVSHSDDDPNQVTKLNKHVGNQQNKQFRPQTWRRIPRNASRKSTTCPRTRTSSPPVSVYQANIRQPHARCGETWVVPKSLHEILDTVKRKKRSVSARKISIYDARKKASHKSTSFKPFSEKDTKEVKPVLSEVTTLLSTHNSSVTNHSPPMGEVASMETAASKAQCTPKLSRIKHLQKLSIARELIRLEATESSRCWLLKDSRRRKDMSKVCVLFSSHLDEDVIKQQTKILARFGVPTATLVRDATHFVADRFVRTKNMLEAMAMGKPVVTHMWLNSCAQASSFIDEKRYILRDVKKEKEFGFSMPVSLARALQQPLLQGRRVYITPHVRPDIEVVRSLVMAAHGQIQPIETNCKTGPWNKKIPDDLFVISCEEDYEYCTSLLDQGVEIYESDLLLNGIIIQKLEFDRLVSVSSSALHTW